MNLENSISGKNKWRRSSSGGIAWSWILLFAALVMTVLEGAFRKWVPVFGEGFDKYIMYFSKDLIFALLLLLPVQTIASPALKLFGRWFGIGCTLLVVGALVSSFHGLNPVGAVLTTRALILLPLLVCLTVPRLAGFPIRWVLWLLLALTIINAVLSVEQNHLPADHFLNRYADDTTAVVVLETGVRATGTFAYITGLGILSTVGIWAGMMFMSIARTQWERVGAWISIAAGLACGLASVSRAPIVIGGAMIGSWLIGLRDGLAIFWRGLIIGAICVIAAMAIGLTSTFTQLSEGLLERSATAGDSFTDRAFGQFFEMAQALKRFPLGNGFGTEQVGGQYYATGGASFNHFEDFLPRLVLETGALGLLGYIVICAAAINALQYAKRNTQDVGVRAALLATQVFLIPMFYGSIIFNHTASSFTWIVLAAVLASAGEVSQNTETQKAESGNDPTTGARRRLRREWRPEHAPFSVTANIKDNNKSTDHTTTDNKAKSQSGGGLGQ